MKIFISWSGDRSGKVADALKDWLKKVIQAVDPWLSSKDIEKGANWPAELFKSVQECRMCIVCLTPENTEAAWLLFESGAISKSVGSRVWTFLVDIQPADIMGPLAFFQHTKSEKEDVYRLVQAINDNLGEGQLQESILSDTFEKWWPDLESTLQAILREEPTTKPHRSAEAVMDEILESVRRIEYRQSFLKMESAAEILRKYLCTTTPRQEKVFRLVEGIGDDEAHTFEEVSEILNLTKIETMKNYKDALMGLATAGLFKKMNSKGNLLKSSIDDRMD